MNDKLLKRIYIGVLALCVIPTVYFIVRIIAELVSERYLSSMWDVLNYVAIGFYGLALLLIVFSIIFVKVKQKKLLTKTKSDANDIDLLKKYQTKK